MAGLYEKEKNLLFTIFGNLAADIQHFGSTAIKGMAAKPIIDIMIVADDLLMAAYTDAKSACVMEIMEKAKSYFSDHPG